LKELDGGAVIWDDVSQLLQDLIDGFLLAQAGSDRSSSLAQSFSPTGAFLSCFEQPGTLDCQCSLARQCYRQVDLVAGEVALLVRAIQIQHSLKLPLDH
jgi:hypothetical protein